MTDEMRYERLAMSIARSHSLVPRVHGQLIDSWAQVYPLLIAPAFHHADAPADVHTAHLINAFVMSSACIPTFLLARRVLDREWVAYLAAVLSVVTPWILYSTMLMTEVASYPVVAWAVFAMQRSIASPSRRTDMLALLAIGLAYVSRTALGTLLVVLPLAILLFEARRRSSLRAALRKHDLLVGAYAALAIGAVALRASGHFSLDLRDVPQLLGTRPLPLVGVHRLARRALRDVRARAGRPPVPVRGGVGRGRGGPAARHGRPPCVRVSGRRRLPDHPGAGDGLRRRLHLLRPRPVHDLPGADGAGRLPLREIFDRRRLRAGHRRARGRAARRVGVRRDPRLHLGTVRAGRPRHARRPACTGRLPT